MAQTEKSGHLAWCALWHFRQDGDVNLPAQENLFLTRWLAIAQKQRHFSREVSQDIAWLLKEGSSLGVRAKLAPNSTTSGVPVSANCLSRMTCSD